MENSLLAGRSIRIDELLVNNEPIPFSKNFCELINDTDGTCSMVSGIYGCIVDVGDTAYAWDGDNALPTYMIIDPSYLESAESIEVVFTFGKFDRALGTQNNNIIGYKVPKVAESKNQ